MCHSLPFIEFDVIFRGHPSAHTCVFSEINEQIVMEIVIITILDVEKNPPYYYAQYISAIYIFICVNNSSYSLFILRRFSLHKFHFVHLDV